MSLMFMREVGKLKNLILTMSAEVEDSVRLACTALQNLDHTMARQVLEREPDTDVREVDIEEECLKILALYQPVAGDLRYVIAVMKINNQLERIGDLAAHIARRSMVLKQPPPPELADGLWRLSEQSRLMLKQSLDAFINNDEQLARKVCAADQHVNEMKHLVTDNVKIIIRRTPESVDELIELNNIGRHLERIADHATNMAEELIYLTAGKIVRHGAQMPNSSAHATAVKP